jgi:2-polyprenyl-6-methoxyphenol hydroxylase-like FAD-dependent oxidoreductase
MTVTGRRPTIEWALATSALEEPGVEIRRGAVVAGLRTGPAAIDGVPHVTGVRLADGEELGADLVVDAAGRRSPAPEWIADIGGRPPAEEAEDFGFTYTGRFFRSADGSVPELPGPILNPMGSISLLCIPADNGTWSTTVYSASRDAPLRRLRDPAVFEKVVSDCAGYAAWLDGEPISEMMTMSGIVDRTRHFVVDGEPVVTGIVSIADAHACTNPSIGRGMTLGLMHTMVMRDVVREHVDDHASLALAFDAATRAELDPWHEATRAVDRDRIAEMKAAIDGRPAPPDSTGGVATALFTAAAVDDQVARWLLEIFGCWTLPMDVFSREGALERVLEVANDAPSLPQVGPDRQRLLELVS